MIKPKTEEEIELLRENAILVSKTLAEVGKTVAPGVTTKELNRVAETFIRDHGAIPSFLGFEGFPAAICASVQPTNTLLPMAAGSVGKAVTLSPSFTLVEGLPIA